MSYAEKIDEHHRMLKKCKEISAFNIGAGRAYYCAFISIKKYLLDKRFDYQAFLQGINKSHERPFSHGTIKVALFKCLLDNKNTVKNIAQLHVLDNLYHKRRIADYEEKNVSEAEFLASLNEMEIVLNILEAAQ